MSQSNKVLKEFGSVNVGASSVGTKSGSGALGALSLTKKVSNIKTTGAASGTLGLGQEGQEKIIVMVTDGGDFTLTLNLYGANTTLTFADVADTVSLVFLSGEWYITSNVGSVAIA